MNMRNTDLLEIIANQENSGVEFKRDDIRAEKLAKEIVGMLNLRGGVILLGVEDDGEITGLTRNRKKVEEWIMNAASDLIKPAITPFWEILSVGGKDVGIITLPAFAPDKPYKAKKGSSYIAMIRRGTTVREGTREEEIRLYQSSGGIEYDLFPVIGTTTSNLDMRRIQDYFVRLRGQTVPDIQDLEAWEALLLNTDLLISVNDKSIPTITAFLLFGNKLFKYLPQASIDCTAFPGTEKDYEASERLTIREPLSPLFSGDKFSEEGVVERVLNFLKRNMRIESRILPSGVREDRPDYPVEALRETIVNALVHRDYSIRGNGVEIYLFSDRLEILSPGLLPNTATIDKIKTGYRSARNQHLREIMRDYGYLEATGMGIPRKIILGMKERNGTEPDFIEDRIGDRFTVILYNTRQEVSQS